MKQLIKKLNDKYSKYFPSKKFTMLAGVGVVLAIIIFIIFFMASGGESFTVGDRKDAALNVENQTITDLIGNDSDGDGIADWEEALWGTDKNKKVTFNGVSDATYIGNKKKELKIEGSVNETKLTETEKFAREFFTSYTALKSSGQIDDDTINSFSNALGQKIVNPEIIDRYTITDVKKNSTDNSVVQRQYYASIKSAFQLYQGEGIGRELDVVSNGLISSSAGETTNVDLQKSLSGIGSAYQNFAKEIIDMSVPESLVEYHLRIANSSNNTGTSVLNMGKIVSDPIVGLSGLSQYQKYSEDLIRAVTDLEIVLSE